MVRALKKVAKCVDYPKMWYGVLRRKAATWIRSSFCAYRIGLVWEYTASYYTDIPSAKRSR